MCPPQTSQVWNQGEGLADSNNGYFSREGYKESRMIMIAHRTRKAQAKQMFKNLQDILNVSINYIKCKPFTYCGFAPAVYANDYNESVWGCRLFYSLKLFHHDFNGEYIADHKTCIKYLQLTLMSLYMHTFSGGLPILRYQENNLHY